jgi:hypothetical protein
MWANHFQLLLQTKFTASLATSASLKSPLIIRSYTDTLSITLACGLTPAEYSGGVGSADEDRDW